MGFRELAKRLVFDRLTLGASLLTILLALTLLAAGPIYSDAVTLAALRRSLVDAPGNRSAVEIEIRSRADDYILTDDIVRRRTDLAVAGIGASGIRSIESQSFAFPGGSVDERSDLAVFVHLQDLEDHATLLGGTWPSSTAGRIEVAVDVRTAATLDLAVSNSVVLTPTRSGSPAVTAVVVAIYEIDDPTSSFWVGQPRVVNGGTETRSFRTFPLMITTGTMLDGLTSRVISRWRVLPDFDQLGLSEVGLLRSRIAALEVDLRADLEGEVVDSQAFSEFEVETDLPDLLATTDRSLTVTRSSVLAVIVQLGLLAGYALVLVSGLVVDARASESELLRARGASPRGLLAVAVAEALMLVAPAAIVAPWLAARMLRLLDDAGPLASIGLAIDPVVVDGAFTAVALASVLTVVLFSLPVFWAARAAQRGVGRGRQRRASGAQRAGLDLAFLVLAAAALWQLESLGSQRSGRVQNRFGVDPLLVVAPVLGLLAGAFLALRVVPPLARLLERIVVLRRAIVPALMGWQIARRPLRYSRSALLLITAVAIGIFAVSYEATWNRSQEDQATQQIGADARSEPNRRTNDSILDLHLVSAHEHVEGIDRSMPVIRRMGELDNSDLPAVFVALDAAAASSVVIARGDLISDVPLAMDTLVSTRPTLTTVSVPGEPTALVVTVRASEEQVLDRDGNPLEIGFAGSVQLVLQDGNGLLHRVVAGNLAADSEERRLTVDLVAPLELGTTAAPTYPLAVVEVEIRTVAPPQPSRTVNLEVRLAATLEGGEVPVDLSSVPIATGQVALGRLTESADVGLAPQQSGDGRSFVIETGSSFAATPVTFGFRPAGTELPETFDVIVTRSWLEAANRSVGDVVALGSLNTRRASARVVASVEGFPTISPDVAEAVILDLPTLQMIDYALARPIAAVEEHWFELSSDPGVIGRRLQSAPFEAVSFIGREQRTRALQTDPPALGTIGALTIGFIAASVFAAVGFLVSAAISARERITEFALLRALGLSPIQMGGWMMAEQAVVVFISLLFGTAIGLGLSVGVLPLIALTQEGASVFPDLTVVHPWRSIITLQAALVFGLVAVVAVVVVSVRRLGLGAALRQGVEP